MHLVLRSSKAKNEWSFRRPKNASEIKRIISKFADKYGIRVLSLANVGNHLHLQVKLSNRFSYTPFIRAITSAIATTVSGKSRWSKNLASQGGDKRIVAAKSLSREVQIRENESKAESDKKFWDYRPYSRVVKGLRAFLNLKDYIRLNQMEGKGYTREHARAWIDREKTSKQAARKSRREAGSLLA